VPSCENIDQKNPRRVIRALEVIELTGRAFSDQRAEWKIPSVKLIGLEMDRADLHERINARVDAMFKAGLVDETRALLKKGLRENQTASQALGYKQVIEHLEGKIALPETIEMVKLRTRQFAKRQFTWFKRKLPCQWIQVKKSDNARDIAASLINLV
jgi:tRNA dimethylallyltransferase